MKEKSNNSVLISRITSMCSNRQISVNKMLLESGAGTSTVDNLKKGSSPTTDKKMLFFQIAGYERNEVPGDIAYFIRSNPQIADKTF